MNERGSFHVMNFSLVVGKLSVIANQTMKACDNPILIIAGCIVGEYRDRESC